MNTTFKALGKFPHIQSRGTGLFIASSNSGRYTTRAILSVGSRPSQLLPLLMVELSLAPGLMATVSKDAHPSLDVKRFLKTIIVTLI